MELLMMDRNDIVFCELSRFEAIAERFVANSIWFARNILRGHCASLPPKYVKLSFEIDDMHWMVLIELEEIVERVWSVDIDDWMRNAVTRQHD